MATIDPVIERWEWEVWYRGPHGTLMQWGIYDGEADALAKAGELAAIEGMERVEVRAVKALYRPDRRDPRGTTVV